MSCEQLEALGEQEEVRASTIGASKNRLEQLIQEWQHGTQSQRLHKRAAGLKTVLNNPASYRAQEYVLSNQVKQNYSFQPELLHELSYCYGNPIQQALHQEFIEIAQISSDPTTTLYLQTYFDTIVPEAIILGLRTNKSGFIEQSSKLADICWVLLDCAQAIG